MLFLVLKTPQLFESCCQMRPLRVCVACYNMQILRLSNLHRDHALKHDFRPALTLNHLLYTKVLHVLFRKSFLRIKGHRVGNKKVSGIWRVRCYCNCWQVKEGHWVISKSYWKQSLSNIERKSERDGEPEYTGSRVTALEGCGFLSKNNTFIFIQLCVCVCV